MISNIVWSMALVALALFAIASCEVLCCESCTLTYVRISLKILRATTRKRSAMIADEDIGNRYLKEWPT